jgi:hypothetical protein
MVAEILLFVPPPFADSPSQYDASRHTLAVTSHQFRGVIMGDARFWAHIYIDESIPIDKLNFWIAQAASAQVVLFLKMLDYFCPVLPERFRHDTLTALNGAGLPMPIHRAHWTAIAEILHPVIMSCRHLYLATTNAAHTDVIFSILATSDKSSISSIHFNVSAHIVDMQRLTWGSLFFSPNTTPRLRNLVMHQVFLLDAKHICASLTHLEITNLGTFFAPDADELLELLEAASRLVSLRLDKIVVARLDGPTRDATVMKYLTHLAFEWRSPTAITFLSRLRLPALQALFLFVSAVEEQDATEFNYFLTTCGEIIGSVSFATLGADIPLKQLVRLLQAMKNLRYLDTRPTQGHNMYLQFHAIFLHWKDLCPKMERIWFSDDIGDVIVDAMLSLAHAARFGTDLHIVSPSDDNTVLTSPRFTIPREAHLLNDTQVSVWSAYDKAGPLRFVPE